MAGHILASKEKTLVRLQHYGARALASSLVRSSLTSFFSGRLARVADGHVLASKEQTLAGRNFITTKRATSINLWSSPLHLHFLSSDRVASAAADGSRHVLASKEPTLELHHILSSTLAHELQLHFLFQQPTLKMMMPCPPGLQRTNNPRTDSSTSTTTATLQLQIH